MGVGLTILSRFDDRGIRTAQARLARFGSAAKGFSGSTAAGFIRAGATMQTLGRAAAATGDSLTRNVTLPLAAIGVVAWRAGSEFQGSMAQVQAASNATTTEMAQLTAEAKKIGTTTMYSAQDAAQAMLELSKSGITAAQMKAGALAQTLKLAAAGGVQLGMAAETTANALNMFGLKAADAAQVSNALAGGANASSASVESLCQGLAQVGPGAVNAGLSIQETTAVLSAFANKGIQGSDAGTSLKTMLTRLVPQTDAAATAMKRLGLDFVDAKGNIIPISAAAQQLKDKLGGLPQAERSAALAQIFGSDATRAATVLMNEGEAGIRKYIAATNDKTAASKMAAAIENSDAGRTRKMQASLKTTAITIQAALAPAVLMVAGKIADLAKAFGNLSPGMQKTIIYGAGIVAALGPVMGTFGRITSLAGGATRGIGNIAMAMGQNAASAPKWAQVVAVPFTKLGAGVKGAAGSVKGFATASKGGAAGARIMAAGQALLNASLFACPIVWVVAAIAGLVIALVVAYKKSETFRQMVDKAWQMLKRATTVVFAAVVRVIKMAIDRIRQNFMRISAVVSAVIGFFGRLYTGVVDKISAVVTYCKSIPEKIKSAIGDLSRTLYDKGASLIRGFGDGIESMINWLKEKARRVADVVKDIISSVASGKSAGGDIRSGGVPGGVKRFAPAGVDRSSSLLQQISPNRLQAGGAPLATPGGVVINRGAVQITFDGGSGLETSDVERVVTKALNKLSAEIVRRG